MRILYSNLLENATLSATNQDANYPIYEVVDTTLKSLFKADTNSSVITCTLADASTVSCFAFGNHNINTLTITLTDSVAATTVYTYTNADLIFDATTPQAMVYETPVSDIVEIEYDITSVDTLYIGGLAAGQYLQMPAFDINPKIEFDGTDKSQKSDGGVLFSVPGVTLETFSCTFNAGSITNFNAINAFEKVMGNSKPFWVDRWEESISFPVLFTQKTSRVSWNKGPEGLIFDSFRLDLEECK